MQTGSMKFLRLSCRVLAVLLALFAFGAFFLNFGEMYVKDTAGASQTVTVTGAELAFGTDVTKELSDVTGQTGLADIFTFKSGWFLFSFFTGALTLLFMVVGWFRKGYHTAGMCTGLLTGIIMTVLNLNNGYDFMDPGRMRNAVTLAGATHTLFCVLSCVAFFAAAVFVAGAILANDAILVAESGGTRPSIFRRFVRFLKDYKGEIKKIVWPNLRSVIRNTIVVLVMCLVVGAFIWLVDYGLGQGFTAVYTVTSEASEESEHEKNLTTSDSSDESEASDESDASDSSDVSDAASTQGDSVVSSAEAQTASK